MTDHIAWVAVFTVFALSHWWAARQAYKERRELYNRLQAGTLRDYTVLQPDKPKIVTAPPVDAGPKDEGMPHIILPLPANLATDGQAAEAALMGE